MKVALITDGINPYVIGGMQKHSTYLAKHLVQNGVKLDLFHFVNSEDEIPTEKEVNNSLFPKKNSLSCSKIYSFIFPKSINFPGHYLYNSLRYSKAVLNKINDLNEYDFIYAKGFTAWSLVKIKKKYRCNIGVNFHGYEMYQYAPNIKIKLQHYMMRYFVSRINKRSDFVFSYGSKISTLISNLGIPNDKIIELHAAIDSNWLLNEIDLNKDPGLKFLFVGRYERRKGILEINEALLNLSANNINVEVHFVGHIPKKFQIKTEKIKTIYHGLINNDILKKKIYDSCDVLICPSYSEGMPNVILEAMSRGLAILATDVGAVKLMVSSKNGILLKNCDSFLIQKAIEEFIDLDHRSIIEMKNNSLNQVRENFQWTNIINKTIKNLKQIINFNTDQ